MIYVTLICFSLMRFVFKLNYSHIVVTLTGVTNMIIYDGEQVFPERAGSFKAFLKRYLVEQDGEYLLEEKTFIYDSENDEFLEHDIQEFYALWLVA